MQISLNRCVRCDRCETESKGKNTERKTEMSERRNVEIKEESERWMTISGDRRGKQWVRDAVYCLKKVQQSGSCNELTIIHMLVTHIHLRLFKIFPALSLNHWCNICHWARICVAFYFPSRYFFVFQSHLCQLLLLLFSGFWQVRPLWAATKNHLSLFVLTQKNKQTKK